MFSNLPWAFRICSWSFDTDRKLDEVSKELQMRLGETDPDYFSSLKLPAPRRGGHDHRPTLLYRATPWYVDVVCRLAIESGRQEKC